jgi:hypothetical protein
MKFIVLIYNDPALLQELPPSQFDATMRGCLEHADDLRHAGRLMQSEQLEDARTAKTIRVRNGRQSVVDGPFAETKEMLGGFNIIEAADMEEALKIAAEFPWAQTGSVEVRPIVDMNAVRRRVGAAMAGSARGS